MADSHDGLLFFKPCFVQKIWGGRRLETEFGYDIPDGRVGECWAISAHPNGDCVVDGGPYDGRTLSELWQSEAQLFGGRAGEPPASDRFPLLIKILDVRDYLSVQVHPDDAYAGEHEGGSLGKSECWYIAEADPDARVMIGQRAKSREEFAQMAAEKRWDELLNEIPIRRGDFFAIEPGTVHAVRGALILETQQSSDVTYRVYDFDRKQPDGSMRELHLEQCLDVIDYDAPLKTTGEVTAPEVGGVTKLMSCKYFEVVRVRVRAGAPVTLAQDHPFMCVSVIEGEGGTVRVGSSRADASDGGSCEKHALVKGSHFLAPFGCGDLSFEGDMELIVSWVPEA
jgi:mannose-6-phosphate isomerase class I